MHTQADTQTGRNLGIAGVVVGVLGLCAAVGCAALGYLFALAAVGLGIVGMVKSSRERTWPIAATALGLLVFLISCGNSLLGMAGAIPGWEEIRPTVEALGGSREIPAEPPEEPGLTWGEGLSQTPQPASPSSTKSAVPAVETAEGNILLTVRNVDDREICGVFISPAESDEWGENWLPTGVMIYPGAQRIFLVPAGVYDLMAVDCNGNEMDREMGVDLDWQTLWYVPEPPE